MSKWLTEKWKNGEIDGGYYYLKMKDKKVVIDHTEYVFWAKETRWETKDNDYVKEVLAPVPSYKEYNKLRKLPLKCFQLEEDNSALMVINKDMCKEIEILQEQLNEANEVIKITNRVSGNIDLSQLVYEDRRKIDGITMQTESYLEKWGVK